MKQALEGMKELNPAELYSTANQRDAAEAMIEMRSKLREARPDIGKLVLGVEGREDVYDNGMFLRFEADEDEPGQVLNIDGVVLPGAGYPDEALIETLMAVIGEWFSQSSEVSALMPDWDEDTNTGTLTIDMREAEPYAPRVFLLIPQ